MTDSEPVIVDRHERWYLEAFNPNGWQRDDITVNPIESQTPEAVVEQSTTKYQALVRNKLDYVEAEGKQGFLEIDDELHPVTIENGSVVFKEHDRYVASEEWNARPTLYAAGSEGDVERIFWDSTTVVSSPEIKDDELVLHSYEDTYIGRQVAKELINDHPLNELPLSINISIVPILIQPKGHSITPVFTRSESVIEYPGWLMTVAGGIDSIDEHPITAGWRELIEEIGVGPDWNLEEYFEYGLLNEESANVQREQTDGHTAIIVHGEDDKKTIYTTNSEITVVGIVRNLENKMPEICSIVEVEIPSTVIETTVQCSMEHRSVEFVPFDRDALSEFIRNHDDLIPVGEAALILGGEYVFGDFLHKFVTSQFGTERTIFDSIFHTPFQENFF